MCVAINRDRYTIVCRLLRVVILIWLARLNRLNILLATIVGILLMLRLHRRYECRRTISSAVVCSLWSVCMLPRPRLAEEYERNV